MSLNRIELGPREGIRLWINPVIDEDDGRPKNLLYIEGQEEAIFKFDIIANERRVGHGPINVDDVFQEFIDEDDFSSVQNPDYVAVLKEYTEEKTVGVDRFLKTYRLVNLHPNEAEGLPKNATLPGMAGILTKDKSDLNTP